MYAKNEILLCSGLLVSMFASFMVYGLFTWFDLAFWLCLYVKKMVS